MKKFGKIFGIASLAFATLTAGVLGLSGCGEKWKNPDKTPDPEKPPIIVTPPEEEVPLISAVSLKEIEAYFKRPDVKLTFDTYKVTTGSNALDFSDDIKNVEFSADVDAEKESANMIAKLTYKDESVETNYFIGSEKALYVHTENAGEASGKRKYVEGEEFNLMLDGMNTIYKNTQDCSTSFFEILDIESSPEIFEFDYSAVKKSLNEEVSYEINFEYETLQSNGLNEQVKVYYEYNLIYNFSNNMIKSLEASSSMTEDEIVMPFVSVNIESIESLDLPTDFDQYILEEEFTLEDVRQYLSDSKLETSFGGFKLKMTENVNNGTAEFSALKEGDTFVSSSQNFFEFDNKTYYVLSDNRVFVAEGETIVQITDEQKVSEILQQNAENYEIFSDAKNIFDEYISKWNSTVEKELAVKRITKGNNVQIVIDFSHNTYISEGTDELQINVNYKETVIFTFVDGKIQSVNRNEIATRLEDEKVIENLSQEISKINILNLPEFPAQPEGGEEQSPEVA